jgi:hypothetical protein
MCTASTNVCVTMMKAVSSVEFLTAVLLTDSTVLIQTVTTGSTVVAVDVVLLTAALLTAVPRCVRYNVRVGEYVCVSTIGEDPVNVRAMAAAV